MQIKKPQHLQALRNLLGSTRYLLCVDLEATCDDYPEGLTEEERGGFVLLVKKDEMETIEVGAVVLDLHHGAVIVDEFCCFVRPVLNPVLTDFCKKLTTIEQADVYSAGSYTEVKQELDEFLTPFRSDGILWCSWGDYDSKQLEIDAARAGSSSMLADLQHTNIKKWHWKILNCRAMSLRPAVEEAGIEWSGQYHRGIDDARNLGLLVAILIGRAHVKTR
jgi:inhibitor of KinA sporulation pathway (predicted exonuclease)